MVNIMQTASAKFRIERGAFHQPTFMDSCLLVARVWPVYLVDELVLVFCTPYDWANGGFVDVFCAWYSFSSTGSWCYSNESVWKSKTKLCCIASGVVSSIPNLRVGLCRLVCVEVYG